jgi:hypothetical protein
VSTCFARGWSYDAATMRRRAQRERATNRAHHLDVCKPSTRNRLAARYARQVQVGSVSIDANDMVAVARCSAHASSRWLQPASRCTAENVEHLPVPCHGQRGDERRRCKRSRTMAASATCRVATVNAVATVHRAWPAFRSQRGIAQMPSPRSRRCSRWRPATGRCRLIDGDTHA